MTALSWITIASNSTNNLSVASCISPLLLLLYLKSFWFYCYVIYAASSFFSQSRLTNSNFCLPISIFKPICRCNRATSEHEFPAHYLVNIELSAYQMLNNPQAFLISFEQRLQAANTFYALNRSNQIPAPRLRILAPGSFAILRQRQLQKGIPDSQLKFPHVSEDRSFLAGLTVLQEFSLSLGESNP